MKQKKHVRFDWAIKRLLRQKANFNILEGFLSELLKEDIEIMEIIEAESNQETEEDKFNRVDILVKDQKGDLIIIEIQNSYAIDYFLRILYGISKTITEHMDLGDKWYKVKKVISVNVVYFDLGKGGDYIYKGTTKFHGIHNNESLQLTNAQKKLFRKEKVMDLYPEIYLIKVDNFDNVAKDGLDEWIYFLKNSEIKKEFTAKGLKQADEVLKVANMEDPERREYQRFMEVLSDRASMALTIEVEVEIEVEKRMKIEMEKRMKAEVEKRMKIEMGKRMDEVEKRMEKEKKEVVANLLNLKRLAEEQIAKAANVSIEFVRKVKEKMK